MQLESFLEISAQRRPDRTALVCGNARWTFAELEAAANRLAHGLLGQGVERGDRVVVYLGNTVETVVAMFAALKAGAIFVPVNPTTKAEKLAYILNNCRARAIVLSARQLATLEPHVATLLHLKAIVVTGGSDGLHETSHQSVQSYDELLSRYEHQSHAPKKRSIDIDLAALIYTSGSTGQPKGVMLTHANMVAAATSITTYLENVEDDIILNVLPLSFDYGLYQVLMGIKIGGTVVLERTFAYPHAVMAKVVQERVTGLPLVPTMSAILLQMDLSAYDLSQLRYITNTGAALPTEHISGLRERLPHVRIYSMYGLTECKRVAYLPPEEIDRRPSSVGKAMPNVEVYVADDEGQPMGPGEVGELTVRGSNVMKGYWELPEETQRVLKTGRLPNEMVLATGDLFRMDEDGYLYFVGRKDDIIKSRGEKVSPKEVENVLHRHPRIAEAVVVGVSDEILGQAIVAVIAPKEGCELTEREILRHCTKHLEDFMVPQSVHIRSSLPKTPNGKIDKNLASLGLGPTTTKQVDLTPQTSGPTGGWQTPSCGLTATGCSHGEPVV